MQTQAIGSGAGIESLGKAVEQSANFMYQKMDEARNYTETTKAKLFLAEENAKLALEMTTGTVTGPDGKVRRRTGTPEDLAYYKQKQAQILQTAEGFHTSKDQLMRSKFEYEKDALVTGSSIQNAWMKNTISEGQAATQEWMDRLSNHYSQTGSKRALEEIDKVMNNAVMKGFYDAEQAYKLKSKITEDSKFNRFLFKYQENPTEAQKNIDTFDLSIENKQKAIRISQETEKIVNENRAVNLGKATEAALNYLITENDVDALVAADKLNPGSGIKEKDAPTLRKAVLRGMYHQVGELAATNESAGEYIESARKVFATKPENRTETYKTILDMYSDNYADAEELKFLNKLTSSQEKIDKINKKKIWFWTDKKRRDVENKKEVADELHSLLELMCNGKSFEESARKVESDSIVTKNPSLVQYPKGRVGIDEKGIKHLYFQDDNGNWVKDKVK